MALGHPWVSLTGDPVEEVRAAKRFCGLVVFTRGAFSLYHAQPVDGLRSISSGLQTK